MKQKTITIDGREYPVVFNMSTLVLYEQTANKSFFGEDFARLYNRIILIYASMWAADENVNSDVLMQCQDWKGINDAFLTVSEMATEFFHIPDIIKQDEHEAEEQQADEQPKND
jgi:hypothetical protein